MPILRVLLSSTVVCVVGIGTLAVLTKGFRAYTSEAKRIIDIEEHPRAIPDVLLETAEGRHVGFSELRGRWLLVEFVYTRCLTYCFTQSSELSAVQQQLEKQINAGTVSLLSISFDPQYDIPHRLQAYQQRFTTTTSGWLVARPTTEGSLQQLLTTFGVTVIADGYGGYEHNSAIAIVNPNGMLVRVMPWDSAQSAVAYVMENQK